ncbi:hypothetical protein [Blastococcus sp. SYSU D00820]
MLLRGPSSLRRLARRSARRAVLVLLAALALVGTMNIATPAAQADPVATPSAEADPAATPTADPDPAATPPAEADPAAPPTAEPDPAATPAAEPDPAAAPTAAADPAAAPTAEPDPAAAPAAQPDPAWTVTNPTVFGLGDSLFWQCGDSLGLGERSLGMVGWNGGTARNMRERMSSTAPDWPFMTESSHAEELAHFRSAGVLVMGLGTNDIRVSSVAQFRADVDWFLQQAQGRPVLWLNYYYPDFAARAAEFNAVLQGFTAGYPNLRIVDWNGFATANRAVISADRLHLADYTTGCENGRFALIRANVPAVAGQPAPVYGAPAATLPSPDPIAAAYAAAGGTSGPLGAPTGAPVCGLRNGGCSQAYRGGLVLWSPAGGAHAIAQPAMVAKFRSTGTEMGLLGYPTADAVCGLPGGGCSQVFEGGTLYWSPATGAAYTTGVIGRRYAATGAQSGPLGYPVMDTQCDLTLVNGCYQRFQQRILYWTPATGAQFVHGAIYDRYAAAGWERGRLVFPLTDSLCGLVRGGCWQMFEGGSIYSSPTAGTHLIYGALRDRWAATGWENGGFGYPVTDSLCGLVRGGCWQMFEGGSIYSSPTAGTHVIYGALRDRWAAAGWENSGFGYPVTDSLCGLVRGGCWQMFEGGSIYSSPTAGTHVIYGAIRDRWAATGWENGGFGYPVTDSICGLVRGGCYQHFEGGSIYSSPTAGTHTTYGAIRDRWIRQGWERGPLGYPVTDPICGLARGGCYQNFEGGAIYSSPAGGTHIVYYGAIRDRWGANGWEFGRYGYPVGDPYAVRGGTAQRFQGGTITYANGRVR